MESVIPETGLEKESVMRRILVAAVMVAFAAGTDDTTMQAAVAGANYPVEP